MEVQAFGNLDGHMLTVTGRKVNIMNPDPDTMCIYDIASGLSNKGHFSGQTRPFFSIAEHSLLVCDLLQENIKGDIHPEVLLVALHHDDSEAYLGDMIKPIKVIPEIAAVWKPIEDRFTMAIFKHLGIGTDLMKVIKPFDIMAQEIEYNAFYKGVHSYKLNFMDPDLAYRQFMERHELYTKQFLKK